MKSRFLTLKPSKTRIEVVETGKGRDLFYLHGASGHMPGDPLIAALATKYRVVAPLLPTASSTARPTDWPTAILSAWLTPRRQPPRARRHSLPDRGRPARS